MEINLTPLIEAVIALILAALSAFVIPWLKQKVSNEKMTGFLKWVDIAVSAAEQLYDATEGPQKKAYVLQYLAEKGYTVDALDVENAIEAAVIKLHDQLYGSDWTVKADGKGN